MSEHLLSTDPYKGVRDFYPEDMAIQRYLFDTWRRTAESFGYAEYDTSILEPSELYKSKGVENEEMVNEQTYTFTDRGGREVTLRPEMTPSVARMVSGRARALSFPVRWYSIPNLFRYERPQRGRLREHWQLNCDIFGSNDSSADIEIIALAYQVLINFGATADMFEIRVNNRYTMQKAYEMIGITDQNTIATITRLNDRKRKIPASEYRDALTDIVGQESLATEIIQMIEAPDSGDNAVVTKLRELGIENVQIDRSLARGFDYYTGTIFEVFDTADTNNRSMLGGGRYDNLTALFGGEAISGIGFGMGDVTMRNFLETHNLLQGLSISKAIALLPETEAQNIASMKIAKEIRTAGFDCVVDYSSRKLNKKIESVQKKRIPGYIVIGEKEVSSDHFTFHSGLEKETPESELNESGTIEEILSIVREYKRFKSTT